MRLSIVLFLVACGSKSPPPTEPGPPQPPPPAGGGECITTGCSGTVCTKAGNDVMTTCEMKPEYPCYQGAECKVQPSGECGWTMDERLQACLANPPPLQ